MTYFKGYRKYWLGEYSLERQVLFEWPGLAKLRILFKNCVESQIGVCKLI